MWNGETESSGTPTQDESEYAVATPEVLLAKVVSERDDLQSRLKNTERILARAQDKIDSAQSILSDIVDDADLSSDDVSISTATFIELCKLFDVSTTTELSIDFRVSVDLIVPIGTTEQDVRNNLDSYIDITVRSADDDLYEVNDYSF